MGLELVKIYCLIWFSVNWLVTVLAAAVDASSGVWSGIAFSWVALNVVMWLWLVAAHKEK